MPTRPKKHRLPTVGKRFERLNANDRGYNYKWQQVSEAFKAENPFCVECLKTGEYNAGSEEHPNHVDHRIPHRGDSRLFWDPSNWQTLCEKHHSQKTARGE